jgi:hypothetical protein
VTYSLHSGAGQDIADALELHNIEKMAHHGYRLGGCDESCRPSRLRSALK